MHSKSNSTARSQDGESSAAKQIWVLHMYIYLYNTKTANSKKKRTALTSDREGNRTNNNYNSYNCLKKQ